MAKKVTQHPWQQIEEQAFHAFREWPLWLVLRERELALQSTGSQSDTPSATGTDKSTQQRQSN